MTEPDIKASTDFEYNKDLENVSSFEILREEQSLKYESMSKSLNDL